MPRITTSFTFEYEVTPGEGGYKSCSTIQECVDFDRRMASADPVGNFKAMIEDVGLHPTVLVDAWL